MIEAAIGRVVTAAGVVRTRATVIATDPQSAAHLLPGLVTTRMRSVTCLYHAARAAPLAEPTLLLVSDARPVASTVVVSEVAPSYSPDGRALVCTTVLGRSSIDVNTVEKEVRAQLREVYEVDSGGWDHLGTYRIRAALPAMVPPYNPRRPVRIAHGLYVCGDHRAFGSLHGAMVSGRRAARAVLEDIGMVRRVWPG